MYPDEEIITSEHHKPTVVLRNEPRISEHDVDQSFNEMKKEFVPYIQQFVAEHDLFKDEEEVGIEFAHKGVSSIIAMIDTATKKLVLKIPRNKTFSAGEGQFLRIWEEAGVSVPHVIEEGELHGQPYTLMHFVDAPTLDQAYTAEELFDNGSFAEMGKILRLMHSQKANGYGFVVDGAPEFHTVEQWFASDDIKTRLDYITEHSALPKLDGMIPEALGIIRQHSENAGSTYCHDDFGARNLFATKPITVFDANPRYNNGYYDLGRIKFTRLATGASEESFAQLLDGYFYEDECDRTTLKAYTFLAFCMKYPYWHKTGKKKELETATNYFGLH